MATLLFPEANLGMQALFFLALFASVTAWAPSQNSLSALLESHTQCPVDNSFLTSENVLAGDFPASSSVFGYTNLAYSLFPNHGIRVKKTEFCDLSVNSYTGYIDFGNRHLFFYFFESRSDPKMDDVIFWTNGGPGCSSSIGLFMELGPCKISDGTGPAYSPHSWNNNANMLFVDQPIAVGYSYADGEAVHSSEEAAVDIAAFIAIFFHYFNQFSGRRLHLAGESYAGRYIPLFASAIYDQNSRLVRAGMTPVNLASVIIGNANTEVTLPSSISSYYDMMCTPSFLAPIADNSSCQNMKQAVPGCLKFLKEYCVDFYSVALCRDIKNFCKWIFSHPLQKMGKTVYDISRDCKYPYSASVCYSEFQHIADYLDGSATRSLLDIPIVLSSRQYNTCSEEVFNNFMKSGDFLHATNHHVSALLDHGVKVLFYAGTYDWICNWISIDRWTLGLDWSEGEAFAREPLRVWNISVSDPSKSGKSKKHERVKRAGRVRSKGGLMFVTIEGAGHLVPFDKPGEALTMIDRWLAGDDM